MGLIELWHSDPGQIEGKRLQQLIAFAGEGKLRDGNDTSQEFRAFLARVPSPMLVRFVDECLNSGFEGSGLALQDVINTVGRRLEFEVTDGLYQGRRGRVGFDGLWTLPTGHTLVVEVKTTDAYRIETSHLAAYRSALIDEGRLKEDASSVLLVVGRQDTGELEAQIRGSRHAWDMRVISAEGLLRLMQLKQTLDDPGTIGKICGLLIPREYTRLDAIVDLVFSAAEESQEDTPPGEPGEPGAAVVAPREGEKPVAFHDACIEPLARREGITLVKQSRSKWAQPDGDARVVCAVSKRYEVQDRVGYWFGFHPYQAEFLEGHEPAFLVLGCGGPERVLALPYSHLRTWLDDLWTTERPDGRHYWHLRIREEGSRLLLDQKKGKERRDITEFLIWEHPGKY